MGQALARSSTDATSLIAKIVYYAILLVTLQLAFGVWGPNPISSMLNAVVAWLPKAVVAIIIIVIASVIARVVKDLVNGVARIALSRPLQPQRVSARGGARLRPPDSAPGPR